MGIIRNNTYKKRPDSKLFLRILLSGTLFFALITNAGNVYAEEEPEPTEETSAEVAEASEAAEENDFETDTGNEYAESVTDDSEELHADEPAEEDYKAEETDGETDISGKSELPMPGPAQEETAVGDDLTEETGQQEEPEQIVYDKQTITSFAELSVSSFSFDHKPALITLMEYFPSEIEVFVGGVREASETGETVSYSEAVGAESVFVPVTWVCSQDYDEELEQFGFEPVIEGYAIAEDVSVPVITVNTGHQEYGRVGGYIAMEREYEIPVSAHADTQDDLLGAPSIPSSYNGYTLGNLPAIRDQGSEGACWSFASIGSVETDLIHDGKMTTSVDLSELQLAYFTAHNYVDPKNGNRGDSTLYFGSNYLSNGGNLVMAYRAFSNMVGPVYESDVPYSRGSSFVPDARFAVQSDAVQVTGAYLINPSDRSSIKQAILDHGSVAASIYADESFYSATYNSYYGTYSSSNHAVMLVGWNDSFPASNFRVGKRPSFNGAWLVRNSWGSENYGYEGYFWLSYYDASLVNGDAVAYDADTSVYDHCYAFDSVPYPTVIRSTYDEMTVVQKYTVDGREKINAVGFEVASADLTVNITLTDGSSTVTAVKQTTSPGFYLVPLKNILDVPFSKEITVTLRITGEDEVAIATEGSGNSQYCEDIRYTAGCGGGGITIDGQKYDCDSRIKLYTMDYSQDSVPVSSISLDKTSLTIDPAQSVKLNATILPTNASDKRITWSSSNPSIVTVSSDGRVTAVQKGNAVVTARTTNGKTASCNITVRNLNIPVTGIQCSPKELTLVRGTTGTITAVITPGNASDKTINWTSSNPTIASVSSAGIVTAKNLGTAVITARTKDGGHISSVTVNVVSKPISVTGITCQPSSISMNKGATQKLTATIYPSNATNRNVVWKSGNTKVASVSDSGVVTAVGAGTATITVRTAEGGYTASCIVSVSSQKRDADACRETGFCRINGKDYWYEQWIRQGVYGDTKNVRDKEHNIERGREVCDMSPATKGWYWLDAVYDGAKAVNKEVYMPYIFQDEKTMSPAKLEEWRQFANTYTENPNGETAIMGDQLVAAVHAGTGKWVRYDGEGKMYKGWLTINNGLELIYPNQAGNTYYYDYATGLMAKGWTTIGGRNYHFDEITGVLLR